MYQCDGGGVTPLMLACQTLVGDDDDTDDDIDFEGDLMEAAWDDDERNEVQNQHVPVLDEIGEDGADYEVDLEQAEEAEKSAEENSKLPAEPTSGDEQEVNNEAPANQNDNQEGRNEQGGPGVNNEDPLDAVMFMIRENGSNSVGIPDDDSETA